MTRTVVSFTTIPERIELLMSCISSLIQQTIQPDVIYIQIPQKTCKGKIYNMDKINEIINQTKILNQSRVKKIPPIIINRPQVDEGPITKLAPILDLEKNKNSNIILVDDDFEYDLLLIETLIDIKYDFLPAIGFSGRNKYLNFKSHPKHDIDTHISFLETFAGVRYKRNIFPDQTDQFLEWIHNQWDLEKKCKWTDDIVIGKWLKNVNIRPVLIPFPNDQTRSNPKGHMTPELRNMNLFGGYNNVCFSKLFNYPTSQIVNVKRVKIVFLIIILILIIISIKKYCM
jgi:hypothetical protein